MGLFKIDVFGSVANGYDLSFADLDLRLCLSGVEDRIRAPSREDVIRLKRYLTSMIPVLQNLGFDTPELVHSRYPLLDTRYPDAAIKVQVVSANNTTLSIDFINLQIQEHPDLPSIYAVIRTMLKIRDLSDVFHGGIGSYTLVMMIIASLKLLPGESAGENLINFLEFYSTIDTKNHTIGLVPPGIHPKYRTKYDIPPTSNVTTREQRVSPSLPPSSAQLSTNFSHNPPKKNFQPEANAFGQTVPQI
jgi:non-canonical poly(A) RNA polymerase PAPD5/7